MKTYFISGVCGVGKSTLIPHLKNLLPADKYVILDFDKRGVPDGADHSWRRTEAQYWIDEAATFAVENKKLIVCGFVKPEDFTQELSKNIQIIVLDADSETIRKRLIGRYSKNGIFDENQKVIGKPVNEFIASNVWYADKMKSECEAAGCPIVDTSDATPEEVATEVAEIIQREEAE